MPSLQQLIATAQTNTYHHRTNKNGPPPALRRARGISALTARQALVASFGSEVTRRLKLPGLLGRVRADTLATLATVNLKALAGEE